jgi:hypothetical protein
MTNPLSIDPEAVPAQVFVFGSNLAGRHGKGAALAAAKSWGAIRGRGIGLQGRAYAIPTKDAKLNPLPLDAIAKHVSVFLAFARANRDTQFQVTAIGTDLAGYTPEQIAPMFRGHTPNVMLPFQFLNVDDPGWTHE